MTNKDGKKEEMVVLKKDHQPPRFLRSYGITDDHILCRKCDDEILGKYENSFKEIWERVFKNEKTHPIERDGKLYGWAKEYEGKKDIIGIKLFILCCIWRASISTLEDYSLKMNNRKEKALRRILLDNKHDKLLHSYSMFCSKFEDDYYPLAATPYFDRKNKKHLNLIRFCLPYGYMFTIRIGLEKIDEGMGAYEFGAFKEAFFISNMGKLEGSASEKRLLNSALDGLRNMYPSDKRRIKDGLLKKYDDITEEEIRKALSE